MPLIITHQKYASFSYFLQTFKAVGGSRRGLMAKVLDCDILVSEFELDSLYCIHFRFNSLGKSMSTLISLDYCSSTRIALPVISSDMAALSVVAVEYTDYISAEG